MKVNDYVKYENEVVKVAYVRQLGDDIYYVLSNGLYYCGEDLPLATPEETLEMFKGKFEEEEFILKQSEEFDTKLVYFRLVYKPKDLWEVKPLYRINKNGICMMSGCTTIPNNLIDLIREFQQWYWR